MPKKRRLALEPLLDVWKRPRNNPIYDLCDELNSSEGRLRAKDGPQTHWLSDQNAAHDSS